MKMFFKPSCMLIANPPFEGGFAQHTVEACSAPTLTWSASTRDVTGQLGVPLPDSKGPQVPSSNPPECQSQSNLCHLFWQRPSLHPIPNDPYKDERAVRPVARTRQLKNDMK